MAKVLLKQVFENQTRVLNGVRDNLIENDRFESPQYKEVVQKMRAANGNHDSLVLIYRKLDEMEKTHERYTSEARLKFIDPFDSLRKKENKWKYNYIERNISLQSYYLIWSDVQFNIKNDHIVG